MALKYYKANMHSPQFAGCVGTWCSGIQLSGVQDDLGLGCSLCQSWGILFPYGEHCRGKCLSMSPALGV